jgi:hypothetical protein
MNTIIRALGTLIALALAGSTLLAEPAPASHSDKATPISAELAKTCRALAIKAHPRNQRVAGLPPERLNGAISKSV